VRSIISPLACASGALRRRTTCLRSNMTGNFAFNWSDTIPSYRFVGPDRSAGLEHARSPGDPYPPNPVAGASSISRSLTRPTRDGDVLPAFLRRCLFARAAPTRQTVHSAGMICTTARGSDCLLPRRDDGPACANQSRLSSGKLGSAPIGTNSPPRWQHRSSARTASAFAYLADRWRCRRLACWHGCQRWRLWADWQHHRRHCRWTDRRLAFTAYRRCNRRWRDRSDHQRFYRRGYFVGHSETDQTIRRRIAANIAKLRELLRRRASDTPGLFIFAARETSHLSQKNKISSGGCVKRPQKLRTDQHGRAAPRRQRWIY